MEDWHVKYRPDSLDEIFGHETLVASLRELLKYKEEIPHSYLLVGPSGVGKTTIARIIAKELGCTKIPNLIEFDAGKNTSVDDTRNLIESTKYSAIGEEEKIVIIIDEAHRLSVNAFDSLLKRLEEPPSYLYWILCTTVLTKIPKTIQTRCHNYTFKEVSEDEIFALISYISDEEKLEVSDGILEIIAENSDGSPRQALVNLSKCRGCKSVKETRLALEAPGEDAEVKELCQLLVRNGNWKRAKDILLKLKEQNPESVRIMVVRYLMKVLMSSGSADRDLKILEMLEHFKDPIYNSATGQANLFLAVGLCLFEGE